MPANWFDRRGRLRTVVLQNMMGPSRFNRLPIRRFVLFGAAHTGAVMLLDLLRQSTQVQCDRNLFSQPSLFPLWQLDYAALQAQTPVYGFKLTSQDLLSSLRLSDPRHFMATLHEQGYHIIYLRRQHLVRHAIALLKAQREAELDSPSPRRIRQPLHISPRVLLQTLKELETQQLEEATILADLPCLRLTYETDLLDSNVHPVTARRLCEFLNIPWQPGSLQTLKLVHQHLADLVENYEDVCEALVQANYEYVLSSS